MDVRDGAVRRVAWSLAHGAEHAFGPGAARRTARVAGWFEGVSDGGVHRVAMRVSPRLADRNPALVKISPRWAATVDVRRQGLRWQLDLRDNLQAVLYYAGRYEPAVRRFLLHELRHGDVVLDAGANIGVHAFTAGKRLKELGGGRVIAFEPAADMVAKLGAGAARNDVPLEVVPAALGERPELATLRTDSRYDEADAGVRSLYGDGDVVQEVSVVRLDDWAREHELDRLDVVKLDIEGSESAALTGATRTLKRLQPRALLVEDKRSDSSARLHAVLDECGYLPTGEVLDRNAVFRPELTG
ncbi:FkbM family methyltransferase [Kribbella soli]|uniref:FkbM family methyltransferase n=1 Tax=Kribbella soli TaxID=1124743 RepID=A0A4V2M0L2_9ACTN|nr:FkbM family methyltransferase [Kribbella soli]